MTSAEIRSACLNALQALGKDMNWNYFSNLDIKTGEDLDISSEYPEVEIDGYIWLGLTEDGKYKCCPIREWWEQGQRGAEPDFEKVLFLAKDLSIAAAMAAHELAKVILDNRLESTLEEIFDAYHHYQECKAECEPNDDDSSALV